MKYASLFGLSLGFFAIATASRAENWPQWRGPSGDGHCAEKNLPTTWSAESGLAWKTEIKGRGMSTPVIWGDKIFVTTMTGDVPMGKGPTEGGMNQDPLPNSPEFDVHLFVLCYDKKDGKLLWEQEVKTEQVIATHKRHNLATPSCVTDGERVYAWFGSGQVACFTMDGEKVWERDLAKEYGPFVIIWGHGSSPVLYEDSLILLCDHTRAAYMVAINKVTGENLWRVDRGKGARSYATPLFIEFNGQKQMIVNANGRVEGLNPANGEQIWSAKGLLQVPVPSPVVYGDTIFTCGGYSNSPTMAVRLGGAGDVTESNILWKNKNGGPYSPSFLYNDGRLYLVSDNGIGTCYNAATGETLWKERVGGNFSSSPVLADGKIYVISEEGETIVLDAGPEFKVISRNMVEEYTLASIAVSDGGIYFRTDKHLYGVK